MAISSTGRSRPHGRDHAPAPGMRLVTWAHGRLVAAPRLRDRHATATRHWPVSTAMAALPTTPHPAPPPYPTWPNQVTSSSPRLRATSTSTPTISIVYEES